MSDKTYTEIIEDDDFEIWCKDLSGFAPGIFLPDDVNELSIYYLLHKTREALNKEFPKRTINTGWNGVYILNMNDTIETPFYLEDYSGKEIEALAQALWFIYQEQK